LKIRFVAAGTCVGTKTNESAVVGRDCGTGNGIDWVQDPPTGFAYVSVPASNQCFENTGNSANLCSAYMKNNGTAGSQVIPGTGGFVQGDDQWGFNVIS
jgi:hypothetical protein